MRIQIGAFNKGDIITIDWGDGNVENANLETMCDNIFSTYGIGHRYPNSNPYIITIKGKIRGFWCYTKHITSLDVSGCPALTSLRCYGNNLTSLEVSKNTALTYLRCGNNNLSASALNKIFNDLPINDGNIYFNDNPGTDTCDKRILDYKRWECNCR